MLLAQALQLDPGVLLARLGYGDESAPAAAGFVIGTLEDLEPAALLRCALEALAELERRRIPDLL